MTRTCATCQRAAGGAVGRVGGRTFRLSLSLPSASGRRATAAMGACWIGGCLSERLKPPRGAFQAVRRRRWPDGRFSLGPFTLRGLGATALYWAARHGHAPAVAALMADAPDTLNAVTMENETALMAAAACGSAEAVAALLHAGAAVDVRAAEFDHTALHMAVTNKSVAAVGALLNARVPVNAVSTCGYTPLHLAAEQLSLPITAILLKMGRTLGRPATMAWRRYTWPRPGAVPTLSNVSSRPRQTRAW